MVFLKATEEIHIFKLSYEQTRKTKTSQESAQSA